MIGMVVSCAARVSKTNSEKSLANFSAAEVGKYFVMILFAVCENGSAYRMRPSVAKNDN